MSQTRRGAHWAPALMKLFVLLKCFDVMKIMDCSPIETIVKSVRLNTNYVFIAVSINNKILMCNFIRFGFATKTNGSLATAAGGG